MSNIPTTDDNEDSATKEYQAKELKMTRRIALCEHTKSDTKSEYLDRK